MAANVIRPTAAAMTLSGLVRSWTQSIVSVPQNLKLIMRTMTNTPMLIQMADAPSISQPRWSTNIGIMYDGVQTLIRMITPGGRQPMIAAEEVASAESALTF